MTENFTHTRNKKSFFEYYKVINYVRVIKSIIKTFGFNWIRLPPTVFDQPIILNE